MKKYIVLPICILLGLALLAGCRNDDNNILSDETENTETEALSTLPDDIVKPEPTPYETVNHFEGVTMTVKKDTATATQITVVFENGSKSQCIYGEFFTLEQKVDENWFSVPVTIEDDYGFDDIGYELAPGAKSEMTIDWQWLYGSLDIGEYRIVKDILDFRETGDFDTYYLAAEFTVK